jgi:hypothetical protein
VHTRPAIPKEQRISQLNQDKVEDKSNHLVLEDKGKITPAMRLQFEIRNY